MISVQTISEPSIIPMTSIESLERLALAIHNDANTEVSEEIVNFRLYNTFVCGYEVFVHEIPVGWSYATQDSGIYTLDGYNVGASVFVASKAGKMICEDLFNKHGVETILSMHKTSQRHITALIKRVGFRKLLNAEDRTLFYKVKSWVVVDSKN